MRKLSRITAILLPLCLSSSAIASDFNLPFVNAAGLGTVYSDWATSADDASTAYTNPAGLVKLPYQQLVFAGVGLTGGTTFKGSAMTPPYPFPAPVVQSGRASSRLNAFMPSFYYSLPFYNNRAAFAIGMTAPFGLGTTYEKDSLVRYLATRSQVVGIDIGPSLAYKINDYVAVGAGFDALRLSFTLNNMFGPPLSFPDAELQNHQRGWGYGWHAGVLFDMTPCSRVGLSFNSRISIHTTGDSIVFMPYPGPEFRTTDQKTAAALPARVQLSGQQKFGTRWTAMATIFYTNWRTFEKITMQNTMTPFNSTTSVTIPFGYHNEFDYSVGATFKANDKWLLRGGLQYMNTPSNDQYRGVADPIGKAIILGFGAHYEQNSVFSYDIAFAHSFFKQMPVNVTTQLTTLNGHNNTQTNVVGAQLNWNLC